jgi:hypothetical protein
MMGNGVYCHLSSDRDLVFISGCDIALIAAIDFFFHCFPKEISAEAAAL